MALIEKKLRGGHHNLSAPTTSNNGQVSPNRFQEKMLKNNTAEGFPTQAPTYDASDRLSRHQKKTFDTKSVTQCDQCTYGVIVGSLMMDVNHSVYKSPRRQHFLYMM